MQDQKKFVELISKNEGILYKVTSIYSNGQVDQQDLYQEVVFQLWKSYGSFQNKAKFSTWLYRVAMNTAVSFLRKGKRKPTEIPISEAVLDRVDCQDQAVEEKIKLLYAYIAELNDVDKGIVFLYLEDKTYEEIAEITGISLSNVATRLSRAKQKMKNRSKNTNYGA